MERLKTNVQFTKQRAIIIGAIAVLLVVIGSFLIFWYQMSKLKEDNEKEFLGIAEIKKKEINEWIQERTADATIFAKRLHTLGIDLADIRLYSEQKRIVDYLLQMLLEARNYENIFIVSPQGQIYYTTVDSSISLVETHTKTFLDQDVNLNDQIHYDFFYCEKHQKIHFEVLSPVYDQQGQLNAFVLLLIDPENHLYPIIESWPLPSKTAESLIIKQDGEEVLFLNKLLHSDAPPLTLRIPLTDKSVPAVQAALGYTGFFNGLDYRGAKVVALVEPILGTPWFIVIKIDADELYSSLVNEAWFIFGFAFVLICLIILGLISVYNNMQREAYKKLFDSQEMFRTTVYSIGDAVIVTDMDTQIVTLNPMAVKLTGWTEDEARNQPLEKVFNIINEHTRKTVENPAKRVLDENKIIGLANHTVLIAKDGTELPIADSGAPIKDAAGKTSGVVLVFRDQTKDREARIKLQQSEERLKLASEATEQGIWDWDVQQNKVYYSKKWLNQIGYEPGELAQEFSSWEEHLHPDDSDRCHQAVGDFLANPEGKFKLEFRFRHKNGEYVWIRNVAEAQLDHAGKVARMYGAHTDITEERKAQDALRISEHFFRSIFENSPLGKSLTGLDGSLKINQSFSRILGYNLEEFKGKKWQEVTHPDDIEESGRIVQSLLDGERETANFEKRYIHKDGHYVWTEVNTSLLRDIEGKPQFFITTINDISKRKAFQEKLNESKENLEKLNQDLIRSNLELEQFAYVASHDLQEPLRMVSSYTQLLEKRYKDQLDESAKEFIHFAVDGAVRMQGLINDLLEFSRVTTKGKSFSKVNLTDVLAQARINLQSKITESQTLISVDELPMVKADEGQLVRLFQNLIDNAIKYRADRIPVIHISATSEDKFVTISVSDNGIGIDQKFFERIFIIFQRLHSRDQYGGTGIGLAICKRIVERHGGKIWLESTPGEGSTFYFTLKLA